MLETLRTKQCKLMRQLEHLTVAASALLKEEQQAGDVAVLPRQSALTREAAVTKAPQQQLLLGGKLSSSGPVFEMILELDPSTTPSSLLLLILLIKSSPNTLLTSFIHSSLQPLPPLHSHTLLHLFHDQHCFDAFIKHRLTPPAPLDALLHPPAVSHADRSSFKSQLTLLWKMDPHCPLLKASNLRLSNHHSILKLLSNAFPLPAPFHHLYPPHNATLATCIDDALEHLASSLHPLPLRPQGTSFLLGSDVTLADLVLCEKTGRCAPPLGRV